MSRIGRLPIPLPKDVDLTVEGRTVKVKGPKGELSRTLHTAVEVAREDGSVVVKRRDDSQAARPGPVQGEGREVRGRGHPSQGRQGRQGRRQGRRVVEDVHAS